jgi:hypothetical protein
MSSAVVLFSDQSVAFFTLGPLFGDGVLPQPANLITVGQFRDEIKHWGSIISAQVIRASTYFFPSQAPGPTLLSTSSAFRQS